MLSNPKEFSNNERISQIRQEAVEKYMQMVTCEYQRTMPKIVDGNNVNLMGAAFRVKFEVIADVINEVPDESLEETLSFYDNFVKVITEMKNYEIYVLIQDPKDELFKHYFEINGTPLVALMFAGHMNHERSQLQTKDSV